MKKQGVHFTEIAKGEVYEKMKKRYNIHAIDDWYNLVATGSILASTFVSRLKEVNAPEKDKQHSDAEALKLVEEQIEKNESNPAKNTESTNSYGVTVKGVSNVMVRFARCCSPVPGDNILGYITKGRGVSVHRADCANLRNLIKTDSGEVQKAHLTLLK